MELTATDVERIPLENLRVSRDEFVAVWRLAEQSGKSDWYVVGVVETCRWLACAYVPGLPALGSRPEPAMAPLTNRRDPAHPEQIEFEAAVADRRLARYRRKPTGHSGWLEGIAATLEWAWRGPGRPPLDISQASAG